MDKSKTRTLGSILLLIFFIVFPFGQLLRLNILLLDVVVGLSALYHLLMVVTKKVKVGLPPLFNFVWIGLFSLLVGYFIFSGNSIFSVSGGLYLVRLSAYLLFIPFVSSLIKGEKNGRYGGGLAVKLVLNSLLVVSVASAVFGLVQYYLYPDTTSFTAFGWDDHLYRLIGTFLDPTFTGIILALGAVLSLSLKKGRGVFFLLTIALALTYSRASYLALFSGVLIWSLISKKQLGSRLKFFFVYLISFCLLISVLPRTAGEGVRLERVSSISARLINYRQSFEVISVSPVFGIGLNNICLAKSEFLDEINSLSHACSGFDSSILTILATTGIVGLIVFIHGAINTFGLVKGQLERELILTAFSVVVVHSIFSNSLFYAFVMGWMAVLIGVGLGRDYSNPKSLGVKA